MMKVKLTLLNHITMKNIAVFCSANELEERYTKPAIKFAQLMAANGYHLVWGAANIGLMKTVSSIAKANGSKLIGVSIPIFKDNVNKNADEIIIAKTLGERKALMLERSDAIVGLVGGIGTLDEITEIIELRKQNHHNKPVVILNTDNFYEGIILQLHRMKADGFIDNCLEELIYFANEPEEVVDYINNFLKVS